MRQNYPHLYRVIVGVTVLSTGLYGCGAGTGTVQPESTATQPDVALQTNTTANADVIATVYAAGAGINGATQGGSDIAQAMAASSEQAELGAANPLEPANQREPEPDSGPDVEIKPGAEKKPEPLPVSTSQSGSESSPESNTHLRSESNSESSTESNANSASEPSPGSNPESASTSAAQSGTTSPSTASSESAISESSAEAANTEQGVEPRSITIGQRSGDVVKILDKLSVSTSQLMVQQTPVDTQHGYLYTANIEHGVNGDTNSTDLHTVLRQGKQNSDGSWSWTQTLIEDRTVHDRWHTAPSVAADDDGYVHVVYNMHNFPWQYKRSTEPHNITQFTFNGQSVTQAELDRSKFENKTTFPTLGYADIPGNQITYPAFFKDRSRDLYLTYRFAAKPKRSFPERTMSGGIAAYDTQLQSWTAVGGAVSVNDGVDHTPHPDAPSAPVSLASDTGWTVYHPRLMFGPANDLHVNWFFRQGIAGAELTRPCYVKTQDNQVFRDAANQTVALPMTANACGNMGYPDSQEFYSVGNSAMDLNGKPHVVLSPIGSARQIVSYNANTDRWDREDSPNNATEIFFDGDNNLWAIASGIRIMVRLNGSNTWSTVYTDPQGGACFPKVSVNESGDSAFIHTHACDQKSVTVYGVRLN